MEHPSDRPPTTPEEPDLYRDLVEHSQDLLCTHDLEGRLLSVNPLPARLLGYDVDTLLRMPMQELLAPEFRNQFEEYLARIRRDGFAEGVMILVARNGQRRIWEYYNTLRTDGGSTPVVRGMAHDVTARHVAEESLRKSEERFRVALKNSPVVVFNQDLELKYTWSNAPGLPWSTEAYLGRTDTEMVGGEVGEYLSEIKRKVLESGVATRVEVSTKFAGESHYYDLTVEPLLSGQGILRGITGAVIDVTWMKQAEEEREKLVQQLQAALAENEYLAYHDPLTGIPNRRLLADRLEVALERAARSQTNLAVFALDLDSFKQVNDRLGHRTGDLVLQNVVTRLQARLRASDTLARTGGDEFMIVAEGADRMGAQALLAELKVAFSVPFKLEDNVLPVGLSIGFAIYPDDGHTGDELRAAADVAMYTAKRSR
jgi:diguanylate cyclase (GGDEF)-like protein/PAS domain S-box-containing protein